VSIFKLFFYTATPVPSNYMQYLAGIHSSWFRRQSLRTCRINPIGARASSHLRIPTSTKHTHIHAGVLTLTTNTHKCSCVHMCTSLKDRLSLVPRLLLDVFVLVWNALKMNLSTFIFCENEPCVPVFNITSFLLMNFISLHCIHFAKLLFQQLDSFFPLYSKRKEKTN
jgi:hypothetical protein